MWWWEIIKTLKVQLKPNNKQSTNLWGCAGTGRWAYNFALTKIQAHYQETGKFLNDGDLRRQLTQLKQTDENYKWLYKYSNNITKQAIKDACDAYRRFFKGTSKFPRFKSKKRNKPSFYQDGLKIRFNSRYCWIEKVGKIKLAEFDRIPFESGSKYANPRVTFDGLHWWISVGIELGDLTLQKEASEAIGIDVGIKDLAITSNHQVFGNINKTERVRRLQKKLKRLQRQTSRKYEDTKKEGGENCYKKTCNIIKLENTIKSVHRRLTNIRLNYIHQITTSLVKAKPEHIVMEDLNIQGMMKNRHLAKAIQEQCLYEFRRQIEYKCTWYGSRLILADRWFPSSRMCSNCGNIATELKLSDRTYICKKCEVIIDRDFNASINLRNYGKLVA